MTAVSERVQTAPDMPEPPATRPPTAPGTPAPGMHTARSVETELTEPVAVIGARTWAAAVLVVVLVATAVTWGLLGRWPQHLTVPAVLVHGTGPIAQLDPAAGYLDDLRVSAGETVRRGTALAEVATPRGVLQIRADVDGVVASVPHRVGDSIATGAPVVFVDPTDAVAHVWLLVSRLADVRALRDGDRVQLADGITGRVTGVVPVPSTAADIARTVQQPVSAPAGPIWVVTATVDPHQPGTIGGAGTATVTLRSVPVYRLVTGGAR